MMTRSGNYWSGKEVRVSIVYAVGGFPSASRISKMAGYAANASSPLWFAQISTNGGGLFLLSLSLGRWGREGGCDRVSSSITCQYRE